MKKTINFLFVLFVVNSLSAQVTFTSISLPSSVANQNLYSISNQGSNLYIAGDGCLLKSINNGTSWSVMLQNNNYYFFDVKFTDSQNGYAVGWPKGADALNKISTLFKTVDGGLNWVLFYSSSRKASASTRFIEGEMRNGAIDFLDESRLIWGCGTTQFYSATGGRGNHCTVTTVQTYSASLPNINKAFVGSSGLLESLKGGVAFGISGYQSSDYYDLDLVTADDLYSITKTNLGNELIKIKVNQTNTSSFVTVTGATNADCFYGIDFLDLNYGFVVGKFGKVAYTTNGGSAWTQVTPFSSEQLNDLLFYNNSNAIIIGNNGTVLKMNSTISTSAIFQTEKPPYNETDITWSNINSGTTNDLFEIEVKGGVTYIAGDGVILKSTDLGNSFSSVYTNPIYKFRDISFVNSLMGWAIGYNISLNRIDVLKTTNGGANWTLQTTIAGTSAGIITGLVIEAYNSNYVLASYADALNSVKKITSDGGVTWTNVGGNYEAAPISDFTFFGTNYTSSGHQGFGSKRTDGGTYVAQNLDNGAGGTLAGCTSLTYSQWIKNYGMNAISTADNHLSIARDMEFLTTPQTQTGWIERTNTPSPLLASDWGCYPTYTATHYYGVKMISSSEIWLCGEKGTVITTRNANGGIISSSSEPNPQKEWFGHNTGTLNDLYDIESLDPSTFLAIGKLGTIIRTSNALSSTYLANSASVITNPITNITSATANGGGNVIFIGTNSVTTKGICWSTSPNPTIVDNITSNGSGTGTYTSNLAGLTPGTIYYVRAYATNAAGTAYGNQISFSTPNIPTLTTNSIINITGTTATSGGNISSDGGASITSRGVCWSTNPSPTILNNLTTNGSGIGTFSSNLTGLLPGTLYYVRAYATNAAGTAYGNQISFTTTNSTTGIGETDFYENPLTIYPNPSNNCITIVVHTDLIGSELELLNSEGKFILREKITENQIVIDISNLLNGLYFMKFNLVNSIIIEKVIKN